LHQFLILYEYYEEYRYVSHYFICEVTGNGEMHLTDAEALRGLGRSGFRFRKLLTSFPVISLTLIPVKKSVARICGNTLHFRNT